MYGVGGKGGDVKDALRALKEDIDVEGWWPPPYGVAVEDELIEPESGCELRGWPNPPERG